MAKRGKYVLFYGLNTQKILKFPGLYVALNRATVVNSENWDAKMLMVMSPLQREEKKDWTKEEGEPPSGIIWQFLFSKASRSLRKESSWTWKDVEMTLLDLHQKAVRAISHFSDCSLATEPDFMAEDCNKGEAGENSSTDQKHLHEHGGSENRCQKEDGEPLRTPWSTWADRSVQRRCQIGRGKHLENLDERYIKLWGISWSNPGSVFGKHAHLESPGPSALWRRPIA